MIKTEIEGFRGYYITPEGLVLKGDRPVKTSVGKTSAPLVRLYDGTQYKTFSVAKLNALTYLKDTRTFTSDVVAYKDGNNFNYHIDNLYWTSRSEAYKKLYDGKHRYSEKRLAKMKQSICRPITSYVVNEDRNVIINEYSSIADAARDIKVTPASIIRCLHNKKYACRGLYWKYAKKENQ